MPSWELTYPLETPLKMCFFRWDLLLDPCRISIHGRYPEQKCLKPAITNSQILQEPSFWGIHVEFPGRFFFLTRTRNPQINIFAAVVGRESRWRSDKDPGGDPKKWEKSPNQSLWPRDRMFRPSILYILWRIWPGVLNIPPVLRDEGDT